MRLLAYEVSPREVTPGGEVAITLYWQALAPMDEEMCIRDSLERPSYMQSVAPELPRPTQGVLALLAGSVESEWHIYRHPASSMPYPWRPM